jgi:hypothetical protein
MLKTDVGDRRATEIGMKIFPIQIFRLKSYILSTIKACVENKGKNKNQIRIRKIGEIREVPWTVQLYCTRDH